MSDDAPGGTSTDPSTDLITVPETDFEQAHASETFQGLKRTHRSFVFPVGVAFLVWYFAYVMLADYAHTFMSTPVIGNVNIGLLLGLLQVVTTFAITTWYVSFANRKLDPLADQIRAHLASGGHARRQPDDPAASTESGAQR